MYSWLSYTSSIFKNKNLRERLFNTFIFVVLFRFGTFVILPGIDPTKVKSASTGFLAILDTLLNSSSLQSASIFSLGISPYISASIMVQIASLTIPYFQRMKKEGASGRAELARVTRYLTLLIAPVLSMPYLLYLVRSQGHRLLLIPSFYFIPLSLTIIMASTMFCIWLADRISIKGMGNGSSVLITATILSGLPGTLYMEYDDKSLLYFVLEMIILFCIIAVTITFMQGVRKIPLQYAGRKLGFQTASKSTRDNLPLGINTTGVMPVIFARTLTTIPLLVAKLFESRSVRASHIASVLSDPYSWQSNLILGILIFFATFFYATILVNSVNIANELKHSNGFIPGVKSGKDTADYIDLTLSRIIFPASIFLVLIALMPVAAFSLLKTTKQMGRFFGGTSMLITIGVLIDVGQRIQTSLFSSQYKKMLENSFSDYNF